MIAIGTLISKWQKKFDGKKKKLGFLLSKLPSKCKNSVSGDW